VLKLKIRGLNTGGLMTDFGFWETDTPPKAEIISHLVLHFVVSGQIESGIFFQFGIVSFTATSCTSGLPVGYTEVFPFLNWIKENIKK
jgi:hypothetical protein